MPPTHIDAIGYLDSLATNLAKPWFSMLWDLVKVEGANTIDPLHHDTLIALCGDIASYCKQGPTTPTAIPSPLTHSAEFLETLSNFNNFKFLKNDLSLTFTKRITVVFGTNGSGKSSLCDAIRVMASPEAPARPLHNVRGTSTSAPTFSYKLRSYKAHNTWSHSSLGYGHKSSVFKYFDTATAVKNVKHPIEPGRLIILSAFRLHLFEHIKCLTVELRDLLTERTRLQTEAIAAKLLVVRTLFSRFAGRTLSTLTEQDASKLSAEISIGKLFDPASSPLTGRINDATELEKAVSVDGLKLLKAELFELEIFHAQLANLLLNIQMFWQTDPATKNRELLQKKNASALIANDLLPRTGTLDDLLKLIRTAMPLCDLSSPEHKACPLCRRELNSTETQLFEQYYNFAFGNLETNIQSITNDLTLCGKVLDSIIATKRNEWSLFSTLDPTIISNVVKLTDLMVSNCSLTEAPTNSARDALSLALGVDSDIEALIASKTSAITSSSKGAEVLNKKLIDIRAEIADMEYAKSIYENIDLLESLSSELTDYLNWSKKLPAFPSILKKITTAAKVAHEELVVSDFESRLNAEYNSLTDREMSAFGVTIDKKGSDASVLMLPQISGKHHIEGVLSEGEQRVHALALFFAELETCPHSVVILDDPISSFDYNHIFNFCRRFRDFALLHATKQFIVLTHNWDLFVQIQTLLNITNLQSHLSIQVLEHCSVVADYIEKIDDLKDAMDLFLSISGQPSRDQKEVAAGKLRRLIESIINSCVFNNQRHQYKQKSLVITAFREFTKIVPLLATEATLLRDLYSKLSVQEHDDPRNAYVNLDKSSFDIMYNQIIGIESAIIGRR